MTYNIGMNLYTANNKVQKVNPTVVGNSSYSSPDLTKASTMNPYTFEHEQ
jgi:hypothetical protein